MNFSFSFGEGAGGEGLKEHRWLFNFKISYTHLCLSFVCSDSPDCFYESVSCLGGEYHFLNDLIDIFQVFTVDLSPLTVV